MDPALNLFKEPLPPIMLIICALIFIGFLFWLRRKTTQRLIQEVLKHAESQYARDSAQLFDRMKDTFGNLALDVLTTSNEAFLHLAKERLTQHTQSAAQELEGKRQLIEQSLGTMRQDLKKVEDLVSLLERERAKKFGELTTQLKLTAEQTAHLQETTYQLREALSNSRARGQWGERMAEDILQLSGFKEGINYTKQSTLEEGKQRPDFTFYLPQDLLIHMDVKFPFDNYLRYLEAPDEETQNKKKNLFLKDVRARIREISSKEYINPTLNTVDYALMFIPNEQVYSFIQEESSALVDEALKNHVILCSPLTLYAMLATIRQAVENFNLEKTTSQIISYMGKFHKQWDSFILSMEKLGKRLEDAQKEYTHLLTTRKTLLEKPLQDIEKMRMDQGIQLDLNGDQDSDGLSIESPDPSAADSADATN